VVAAGAVGDLLDAVQVAPKTFMVANVTRSVRLTPAASVSVPSAFITGLDAAHAADVLVGLGLQVGVGVVVAAEAEVGS
jgi:hypothetical protein